MDTRVLILATAAGAFVVLGILTIAFFRRLWRKKSRLRDVTINLALLFYTVAFMGLGLEYYFYRFAIVPEGFAITLATKRWLALHYNWNSRGYRDAEQTTADFEGKKALIVVGDSFAAGSGIPNQKDRFSDQLAMRLGPEWRVANIAVGGWDTVNELEALKEHPVKPDIVVLSYYLNDIKHAAVNQGHTFKPSMPNPPTYLRPLMDNSYAVNAVYWRAYRARAQFAKQDFWENLKKYFADEAVWREHKDALEAFIAYCSGQNIELYVLIFPNLNAIEESIPITEKVAGVFETHGITVVDLSETLKGKQPATLVVNKTNAHANEAVHHKAAELLETEIREHSALMRP